MQAAPLRAVVRSELSPIRPKDLIDLAGGPIIRLEHSVVLGSLARHDVDQQHTILDRQPHLVHPFEQTASGKLSTSRKAFTTNWSTVA